VKFLNFILLEVPAGTAYLFRKSSALPFALHSWIVELFL